MKLTGEGRVVMWPFGDHAAGDEEGFHELDTTGYEVRGAGARSSARMTS